MLGMNIIIHVLLIFIIYNMYIICPLKICFFNNNMFDSSSELLEDLQDDDDPNLSHSNTNELECYCLAKMEHNSIDVLQY